MSLHLSAPHTFTKLLSIKFKIWQDTTWNISLVKVELEMKGK